MTRTSPMLAGLFALLLGGCSAGDMGLEGDADTFASPSSGTATASGDTGTTTIRNTPEYYAITGSLEVVGGELDPLLSSIDIDYRNTDAESICTGVRPVTSATAEPSFDPDIPLYGWWTVELDLSPCGDFGPDQITLGLGAWNPQLDAAAQSQNLNGADLYALYAQTEASTPVYVFGAAGTTEQLNDSGPPPVTAGPVPDGTYLLRTLFLLPVLGP